MSFSEMGKTKRGVGWFGELGGAENAGYQEFCFGCNSLKSLLDLQVKRAVNSYFSREVRDRDMNLGTYRLNFYMPVDTLLMIGLNENH